MRLDGKTALVVGGGRGIGFAIAEGLAREGAKVIIADPGGQRDGRPDDSNPSESAARELASRGLDAVGRSVDATDFNAAGDLVRGIASEFGSIDILVNSAGVVREKMIWNMPEEDWDVVFRVHVKAAYNMVHHASKVMRERQFGRIINLTSQAWLATVGQSNYGAAKGAIWSLTRALARELGRYGITCNSISPTAATRLSTDDKAVAGFKKRLEAGLITQQRYDQLTNISGPEYIAPLATWLCTDAASNVNGQNIRCVKGRIAMFSEPVEITALVKADNDGMFTVDDLDQHFAATLMAGIVNPAPAQKTTEGKTA